MWKNKRFIGIAVFVMGISFVSAEPVAGGAARTPSVFEDRFEFYKSLPVGIRAGTSEYQELLRIESISFEAKYGNAWGAMARVGWLPVKDATWRLAVELLDKEGNVLRHSRDEPTVFTCKAGPPGQPEMQYADLDLDAMHYQGRRHAALFRISLEPSEVQITEGDIHTLEVTLVDRDSREPIGNTAVIVSSSYLKDTIRRSKALYVTDSHGRRRITLVRDGLAVIRVSAQKQGYCTIEKSWSNSGSWPLGRTAIVNLPERHVLEMVPSSALGGIVQDTEGKPIAGAEVQLNVHSAEPSGTIYGNRVIRTNSEGRWRMDGIPGDTERFTLRVTHPEYGGNNGRNRQISGDALSSARALKHVETLEKGLTVTGRVLDEKGQPLAGATVMLAQRSYNSMNVLTDTSGGFRLVCSNDPSDYPEATAIIIEAPGYSPVQQPFVLEHDPKPLEFRLQRGRNVTCRVVDTKGRPVAGAWTVVEPLPDQRDYSVWLEGTDDRGEFQIPNMPQSDVKITIGKVGYIAIRDHIVAASEKEAVVTIKHVMRVRGTVADAETGKSIPHFDIAAVYMSSGKTRTSRPVAFAEGTYEVHFDEAKPDTQQLQVSAVGYEPATSDQITVDEGERVIDFKLVRSASFDTATAGLPREQISPTSPRRIAGVVRDEQGKPVPDAVIITFPRIGVETITNAKGEFTLKLRGTQGSMGSMREQEITYLLARQKERNLAVAMELDKSADTVDITLAPGAVLSGKVVDVDGEGIPGAELSLTFWTSTFGYGIREATDIDRAGRYEIMAVPGGHKYSVEAAAGGYGERYVKVNTSGATNERIEVEPLVLSVANLSASGIVVDDLDRPVSDIRIYAYGNGQPSRETFTDTKGRFTIENICPGKLNIQANSKRDSARRFHGRARAEGGATNIKIVIYEMDKRGRRVPSQLPSLVGKALPDLKELGIDALPGDITGSRILVCFWDMNQRPSRNCITQLANRAKQLKEKGVAVVTVQASKVDEKKLNEWLKKNNIPFPAGMVHGDEKKTHLNWGVKSLPWLILADSKHLVRVEGFAMNELEAKLQQNSGDSR